MNLEQAMAYAEQKLKEGHKSDGCTYAPDLGIKRYCVMHDMLRRFSPVTALEADNLFFEGIMTKGWRYLPVAILYWAFVRLVYFVGAPALIGIIFMSSFIAWAYWRG